MQRSKMVLEQTTRWSSFLGCIRAFQSRRIWYVNCIGRLVLVLTVSVDSNMARDSFATFIPLSVESDARTRIIFDFFDLLSAIAAHGKTNGLGGRKLSRLAGWWAFEQHDGGSGFEGGYKIWTAYVLTGLRSLI